MPPHIRLQHPLTAEVRDAIIKPLLDHNQWHGMGLEGEEMALALVDDTGGIAGGLLGYWRDGWLHDS